jgi:serine/threonine-protein kinase RsbW
VAIRTRSELFKASLTPSGRSIPSVAMPEAMAERGRGLALAQTVLDQLSYRCDDLGNQWTLISQRFA